MTGNASVHLSYAATVGYMTIALANLAVTDPDDYRLRAPACKDDGATIWRDFKRCIEKI
jgi:hypothetical protein